MSSSIGVPGHCWGLDGEAWHDLGKCVDPACDHQCCTPLEPGELPSAIAIRRLVVMDQVARLFDKHPEYKTVVFHREVILSTEILVAVFLSAAGYELSQHILQTT